MDAWLQKLPGSPRVKVFIATTSIIGALAYPVFRAPKGSNNSRQGHSYLSQEKPEAVTASEEKRRRLQRQQQLQQQQQQQEPPKQV